MASRSIGGRVNITITAESDMYMETSCQEHWLAWTLARTAGGYDAPVRHKCTPRMHEKLPHGKRYQ